MSLKAFVGLGVVVFSAIAVVSGIRAFALQGESLEVARQAAVVAVQYADSVTAASVVKMTSADSAKREADKERRRSDRLAREAVALESELGRLEVAYALAAETAPDTCAEFIARADSVLEQAGASVLRWHAALLASQNAVAGLSRAYDSVAVVNADLQRTIAGLSAKTGALVSAVHVPFFKRLLPQPHVGVTVGLDATGRPSAVIGIGAGWRL